MHPPALQPSTLLSTWHLAGALTEAVWSAGSLAVAPTQTIQTPNCIITQLDTSLSYIYTWVTSWINNISYKYLYCDDPVMILARDSVTPGSVQQPRVTAGTVT